MPENIFCSKCGAQNSGTGQYCQKCGGALWVAPAAVPAAQMQQVPLQPASVQPGYAAPSPAYVAAAASPYGGFWMRFLAYLIDRIIVGIAAAPFLIVLLPTIGRIVREAQDQEPSPQLVFSIVAGISTYLICVFIGYWLYESLLTASAWQGTIGKRILRLKVTDEQGNRISFGRSTGRFFAKILSHLVMYIGLIMVAFADKKRGLHDMIAGTLVMKY
jgi:uncharacterized RDD family membrane protein YckC